MSSAMDKLCIANALATIAKVEERDERGRFTSGGGGSSGDKEPVHPTWLAHDEGQDLVENLSDSESQLQEHANGLSDLRDELDQASSEAKDVTNEEDDAMDKVPEGEDISSHPAYKEWEDRNVAAQEKVAQAAKKYRDGLADHISRAQSMLDGLDRVLAGHAKTHD